MGCEGPQRVSVTPTFRLLVRLRGSVAPAGESRRRLMSGLVRFRRLLWFPTSSRELLPCTDPSHALWNNYSVSKENMSHSLYPL
ncbi:uncharacterized protein LOC122745834 isoform X2 [Dromiciops gliroides]|uniref:uncharacterized protein LOC122745834 isoform X2 n=1 Tax=Dromiciops gliroides TaxID=33562 RepID=UPI001CC59DDD|nr:uncharacterized protein LOC122745834 isoform X2 [Dromiciops gliroides]